MSNPHAPDDLDDWDDLDLQWQALAVAEQISTAWARVRILLNSGKKAQAVKETAVLYPRAEQMRSGKLWMHGLTVYGLRDIPVGWVYVHPATGHALMSFDVLREFAESTHVHEWVGRLKRAKRPAWRPYDLQTWREQEPEDPDWVKEVLADYDAHRWYHEGPS